MNYKAFTLAEVLITIGIIGIVASMTLPTLIAKHKKSVVETSLSKAYNVFSNAIRFSELDNDNMEHWPTGEDLNMEIFWDSYIKPYFVEPKLCLTCKTCGYDATCINEAFSKKWSGEKWLLISEDSRILFKLNDGTVIFFPRNTSDHDGKPVYVKDLYIDINGEKLPNELGRDVFYFTRNNKRGIIIAPEGDCKQNRKYCTNEIMSNGWKIPSDYPYKF